jgi:hypothetical protein
MPARRLSLCVAELACSCAAPSLDAAARPPGRNPAPPRVRCRAAAHPRPRQPPFAVVGDTVDLSAADYQRALAVAMRKKYYHAKPPEAECSKFQREVGDEVVNRVLLLAEARKRGIKPDASKINTTIAGYDAQYKGSANWAANRDKMLAAVVPQLEKDSQLERLEKLVKRVPDRPRPCCAPTTTRTRSCSSSPSRSSSA